MCVCEGRGMCVCCQEDVSVCVGVCECVIETPQWVQQ